MGLISKQTVRAWLDNYEALDAGDVAFDGIGCNSGPKEYDGIGGRFLTKVMLDDAITDLPRLLKLVVICRWIQRKPVGESVRILDLTRNEYYKRCDMAVDHIHSTVNGRAGNYQSLLNAVKNC